VNIRCMSTASTPTPESFTARTTSPSSNREVVMVSYRSDLSSGEAPWVPCSRRNAQEGNTSAGKRDGGEPLGSSPPAQTSFNPSMHWDTLPIHITVPRGHRAVLRGAHTAGSTEDTCITHATPQSCAATELRSPRLPRSDILVIDI
jgi:hypothetical protein